MVGIVFNDAQLSLIALKTDGRALPAGSLDYRPADLAGVMRSLGGLGCSAPDEAAYGNALNEALAHVAAGRGPALIDGRVDPQGYPAQLKALRG